MIKTFTQNDLIRYIYQETTKEENIEIENALIFDEVLANELIDLKQSVKSLDEVENSPSALSINKILNYSKSFDKCAIN